jgi:hypothetical protein
MSRAIIRRATGLAVAGALVAGGACTRPPVTTAAGLTSFTGCDGVLEHLKDEALARVGPYGLAGGSGRLGPGLPGPPAPTPAPGVPGGGAGDHSGTNVQEIGVDEPDIVKNDGRRLLAVNGDQLHILDLRATPPRLAGSLRLAGGNPVMLVQGDHVLVLSMDWGEVVGPPPPGPRPVDPGVPIRPGAPIALGAARTRLTLVDIADVTRPVARHSVVVDGSLVDARLVGGRARVVTTAGLRPLPFVYPVDGSEAALRQAERENQAVIRRTTIGDWLPKVRDADGTGAARDLVACSRLSRPERFSGFSTLSVLSLDLGRSTLDPADTVAVVADGAHVYASTRTLVVTTRPFVAEPTAGAEMGTALHAFDVSVAGPAAYRASGRVEGALLSQWSMSEHDGHLRVVTTTGNWGCGSCNGDQSQLSVLRLPPAGSPARELPVVGTVGGMGKGEAVKAVRFMGDRAYVVTFLQIDPFYVLDLSDPTRPLVAGELEVPGYSAYLHPVGNHQVLGVGRDATPEGRVVGTKVSLYDVADPARPTEVGNLVLADTYTSVEHTAKAFLWWEPRRLAVVPVSATFGGRPGGDGGAEAFTGALGLEVGTAALRERGRVTNEPAPWGPAAIERSAVAGDRLLTVSATGVRVSDLATLAPRHWVPFPD